MCSNDSSEFPSSGADCWVQADYACRDLSKVIGRGANSMNLKEFTSSFCNGEVVKYQAPYTFSADTESYKNLENGSDLS